MDNQPKEIQKPLNEPEKLLRDRLSRIRKELDSLYSFDAIEHIDFQCDQLESDVMIAVNSAIKHFNEMEKEMLEEIQKYRQHCLDAWSARTYCSQPEPTKAKRQSDDTQPQLDQLKQEVEAFDNKWQERLLRPEAFVASENETYATVSEVDGLTKKLRTIKRTMKSQLFDGKLMAFEPHVDFFDDKERLKEIYNFKLRYESLNEMTIQPNDTSALSIATSGSFLATFLADGRLATCTKDHTIKIWDTSTGTELFELTGSSHWIFFLVKLPNGWLASDDVDTVIIWDLGERKAVRRFSGNGDFVYSMQALKNGNLAVSTYDASILIWNPYRASGNLLMTLSGHGAPVGHVSFSILSNGYLVRKSTKRADDGETGLEVRNMNDGEWVKTISTRLKGVSVMVALSNDELALGFDDGAIKLIDSTDETKSRSKEGAHKGVITCLFQLSNGNLLSAGIDTVSDSIKMWDLLDLTLLQTVSTVDAIFNFALSPDETLLVSASQGEDPDVKLWHLMPKLV